MPPNNNIRGAYREMNDIDTSVFVEIQGSFVNDTDASNNGVALGEVYELAQNNTYGLPFGTLKVRREP